MRPVTDRARPGLRAEAHYQNDVLWVHNALGYGRECTIHAHFVIYRNAEQCSFMQNNKLGTKEQQHKTAVVQLRLP